MLGTFFLITAVVAGVVSWMGLRHSEALAWERAADMRVALGVASREAARRAHRTAGSAHLLLAVTLDPHGRRTLVAAGIDPDALRADCEELVEATPKQPPADSYRTSSRSVPDYSVVTSIVRRALRLGRTSVAGLLTHLLYDHDVGPALKRHGGASEVFSRVAVPPESVVPAVELMNDQVTTFEFVRDALCEHAALDVSAAAAFAVAVHERGRERIPVGSLAEAERVAGALVEGARAAGYPLQARAIPSTGPAADDV
ncbi:MAG: ATP-dependent Clp protease adaptor ClpS [Deltaproteobacteria bacterium]|nr:ATP-dependent Clp protease adaptor ClpS [Deltaproteobacteria bacterium]